jgi:hypothetical protein
VPPACPAASKRRSRRSAVLHPMTPSSNLCCPVRRHDRICCCTQRRSAHTAAPSLKHTPPHAGAFSGERSDLVAVALHQRCPASCAAATALASAVPGLDDDIMKRRSPALRRAPAEGRPRINPYTVSVTGRKRQQPYALKVPTTANTGGRHPPPIRCAECVLPDRAQWWSALARGRTKRKRTLLLSVARLPSSQQERRQCGLWHCGLRRWTSCQPL